MMITLFVHSIYSTLNFRSSLKLCNYYLYIIIHLCVTHFLFLFCFKPNSISYRRKLTRKQKHISTKNGLLLLLKDSFNWSSVHSKNYDSSLLLLRRKETAIPLSPERNTSWRGFSLKINLTIIFRSIFYAFQRKIFL